MPIQIGAKGATINGQNIAPYSYVDWLSPAQEAAAVQGGDAVIVPAKMLSAAEVAATRALVSGAGNPLNTMICHGDSLTARLNTPSGAGAVALATSFLAWACARLGGALRCLSAGVSGNTTAQMLARYPTDVAPVQARWLHVLGGGNDVTGITTAAQIATTINNLAAIIALARAESRVVVLGTIYPFGSHTTAIQSAAIQQINAWVRRQASEGVRVADYYAAMVDQSGAVRSGYYWPGDTIHPSPLGASAMANALVAAMANTLPARQHMLSSSLWDADNACRYGGMVGNNANGVAGWAVAGGVTGNGPSYWTGSSSGAIVAAASKQARPATVPAADYARLAITTSGVDDSYVRLEIGLNMRVWSANGTANGIRRFYVPSTGCQYDVLVAGALAATDQTSTWPTDIGAVFTAGTATLMCVPPLVIGSTLRLAVECVVSGVSVGQVLPEAVMIVRNTAAATLAVGASLQNGLVATDGAAPLASDIATSMVLETPDIIIPAGWDLAGATSAAGPSLTVRLNLYVRNSALATVDWGRATVRVA